MSRNTTHTTFVALIADNPETIDELQAYLSRAGVVAHGALGSADANEFPAGAAAAVWFADDFATSSVIASVDQLRRLRPGLRILLVTTVPHRFAGLFPRTGDAVAPIVLQKPVVGRNILDALRPAEAVVPQ